ncbi:hypothetical protein OG890_39040 [Streptomyces anulatus]|nr:hypothetical protein [Streptomyces anulatus]
MAYVLDDPAGWQRQMAAELAHSRHRGGWIRIHDAGDFLSDRYLPMWLRLIAFRPGVNFYAYTKEVSRFRRLVEPTDRVADVFPDEAAILSAGYHSQDASDLLAVLTRPP